MNGGKNKTILDFTINKNKINCCGCQACFNACPKKAISMIEDNKGFKYPIIDKKKCVNCGLCKMVCPIKNNYSTHNITKAYACVNIDEYERKKSSSGGIFILLAHEILREKGVIVGAAFNENFEVKHICAQNESDLSKLCKSKYVQSDINTMYSKTKKLLEENKKVLFTGTPCQIEGLYSFLKKNYDNLYTHDVICHGVPSPRVWEQYKKYIENNTRKKIKNIEFRNKEYGWKKYYLKITFEDDSIYKNNIEFDPYLKLFLKDIILRDSCYECKFKKINRKSDITLADFWGVENIQPDLFDNKGISAVIINSEKGQELFDKIIDKIKYKEINVIDVIQFNPSMIISAEKNGNIKKFFNNYEKDGFDFNRFANKIIKKSFLSKISVKIKCFIKNIKMQKKMEEIKNEIN